MKLSRIFLILLISCCLTILVDSANAAITNGGFEDTIDFNGWTYDLGSSGASIVIPTDSSESPHTGFQYATMYGSNYYDPAMLYQVVQNPDYDSSGTSMDVSFSAYGDSGEGWIGLYIWYSNDDQVPDSNTVWTAAPGSGTVDFATGLDGNVALYQSDFDGDYWEHISYSATWSFEAKWFKIGIALAANNCDTWVDTVSFSPSAAVPVPSGIILMVFGLLCLVRIKRAE